MQVFRLIFVVFLLSVSTVYSQEPHPAFVPEGVLRKNVEFWVRIYTQYNTDQGLIHDAKYIDHIYETVDLHQKGLDSKKIIQNAKKKWRQVLLSIHRKQKTPDKLTEEERLIFELFRDVDEPSKFLNAAHRRRLRFQLGQKDRFAEGIYESGRYLPAMEELFRKEGLPVELTRLPFVESSFNTRARSKVGASGIWQFMRSTGRHFLKINEALDERNDPIRAAEAAAKLLKINYESLGTWPLAVTAYNHGRQGMLRAVRRTGSSDFEDVFDGYRSRTFGFASSNFFAELMAALEVERNAEKYFGKIERAKPDPFFEVKLPDYINIRELVRFLALDLERIKELNPGLTGAVFAGKRHVPAGYRIRLPFNGQGEREGAARVFLAGYNQIPALFKLRRQPGSKYGK